MIVVNLGLVASRKFIVVVEEVGFSDTIQVPIALCRCYGNLIPVHIPYTHLHSCMDATIASKPVFSRFQSVVLTSGVSHADQVHWQAVGQSHLCDNCMG